MARYWHQLLLLAVLLFLAGTATWLALAYPDAVKAVTSVGSGAQTNKNVEPIVPETLKAQLERWDQPPFWVVPETKNKLLTPRRFLYFTADKRVQLAGPDVKIDDVPLDWLLHNNLDPSDPDVLNEDADGDGFTNREEFLYGTNPRDPKSHPTYAKLLRLIASISTPFRLTFASVNSVGGENVFQINTPDGKKSTHDVKVGDAFESYTVVAYRPKQGEKKIGSMTVEGDISELELKNNATGAPLILVIHDEQNRPDVSATFVLLLANAFHNPITVQQGHDFTIQASPKPEVPVEALHFVFVSLEKEGAKVVNPETKETLIIPKIKEDEASRFSTPASDAISSQQ